MSHNDITGDKLVSNASTDAYRDGWDRIFGKKNSKITEEQAAKIQTEEERKADLKLALRQSDDIRAEWYEYCLAQEDRAQPFPTFREFFEKVFAPRNPERAAWLRECSDTKSGFVAPTMSFDKYMESRK
jgi:beta-phosphoglucomutase-like phosphatase (HAD superfamily)